MITDNDFSQNYEYSLTYACLLANERFPDIPKDEWSITILCHTEGRPQVTLFHNQDDIPSIEITTPIEDEASNKAMIICNGVMELV